MTTGEPSGAVSVAHSLCISTAMRERAWTRVGKQGSISLG